jgi:hypothetical protein
LSRNADDCWIDDATMHAKSKSTNDGRRDHDGRHRHRRTWIIIGIEAEIELAKPRPGIASGIGRGFNGHNAEKVAGANERQM